MNDLVPYVPSCVLQHYQANPLPLKNASIEEYEGAVLLADISGFTALSRDLSQRGAEGAAALSQFINSYFSALIKVSNDMVRRDVTEIHRHA
jgi:hypothetical protein